MTKFWITSHKTLALVRGYRLIRTLVRTFGGRLVKRQNSIAHLFILSTETFFSAWCRVRMQGLAIQLLSPTQILLRSPHMDWSKVLNPISTLTFLYTSSIKQTKTIWHFILVSCLPCIPQYYFRELQQTSSSYSENNKEMKSMKTT